LLLRQLWAIDGVVERPVSGRSANVRLGSVATGHPSEGGCSGPDGHAPSQGRPVKDLQRSSTKTTVDRLVSGSAAAHPPNLSGSTSLEQTHDPLFGLTTSKTGGLELLAIVALVLIPGSKQHDIEAADRVKRNTAAVAEGDHELPKLPVRFASTAGVWCKR
jgi:hypothetical protein